jgi:hypothetical protein
MPSPAPTKTYFHSINNEVSGNANSTEDAQQLLWGIKEQMKALGSGGGGAPWTVTGSSDAAGAFGNNDNVDRWVDPTDLRFATSGNISWITMQQSAINAKTQIMFYTDYGATGASGGRAIEIVLSPQAGFGAANGGTDGSATVRPTATDEIVVHAPNQWLAGLTTASSYWYHVAVSSDGEMTIWTITRGNRCTSFFFVGKPRLPKSGWTNPVVAGFNAAANTTTDAGDYNAFNDNSNVDGSNNGTALVMRATTEMAVSSMVGQLQAAPDVNGEWPLTPMGLRSLTAGHLGHAGEIFDMRWCAVTRVTGDTYPGEDDGGVLADSWAQFGDIAIPWPQDPTVRVS